MTLISIFLIARIRFFSYYDIIWIVTFNSASIWPCFVYLKHCKWLTWRKTTFSSSSSLSLLSELKICDIIPHLIFFFLSPSLPPSQPPSLLSSLSPSLPPSLSPSLPLSLPPSPINEMVLNLVWDGIFQNFICLHTFTVHSYPALIGLFLTAIGSNRQNVVQLIWCCRWSCGNIGLNCCLQADS